VVVRGVVVRGVVVRGVVVRGVAWSYMALSLETFLDFSELGVPPVVVSDHDRGRDRPRCRSQVLCGKLGDTAQPKCSVLSS
jgi:hypothetical protein